jgi:hypothetical protein
MENGRKSNHDKKRSLDAIVVNGNLLELYQKWLNLDDGVLVVSRH